MRLAKFEVLLMDLISMGKSKRVSEDVLLRAFQVCAECWHVGHCIDDGRGWSWLRQLLGQKRRTMVLVVVLLGG